MEKKIAVLLATHNSENYIKEQLDSIFKQTYDSISIIISDDASTDSTVSIITEYMETHKNISLIKSETPLKSAQANFWFLLKNAPEHDYYMFCDHDDVWCKDKIEKTLNKMVEIENEEVPALVHTDLFVVDKNKAILSPSMFSLQKLSKEQTLAQALIQNNVTGCTMMINSRLKNLAQKKDNTENMLMHDWYLSILCLATGVVGFVDEPLILYRQHGNNEVGAKDAGKLSYILKKASSFRKNSESIRKTYLQAADIAIIFKDDLNENYEIINTFGQFTTKNKLKKISLACKYGFWKNTFLRKIGQIIFM